MVLLLLLVFAGQRFLELRAALVILLVCRRVESSILLL
jgi:hypothetical protein